MKAKVKHLLTAVLSAAAALALLVGCWWGNYSRELADAINLALEQGLELHFETSWELDRALRTAVNSGGGIALSSGI